MKKMFIFVLFLFTLTFSEKYLQNDYVDSILNLSSTTITSTNDISECEYLINETMRYYKRVWPKMHIVDFNPFPYNVRKMFSLISDTMEYNQFSLTPDGNYAIFKFNNLYSRDVILKVKKYNVNITNNITLDKTEWKRSATLQYNYGIQDCEVETQWLEDGSSAKISRCTYLYNQTLNCDEWKYYQYYTHNDLVEHQGKIYNCVYSHTSQVNLAPGLPGIWIWQYVGDVQPDVFEFVQFNIFK